jgi:hypothetical protein
MSDTPAAPERIWATGDGVNGSWTSQEIPPKWGANAAEYVRAVTVQAQIDAAREAALREALVALQGAGSFGRTTVEKHAALEQYCLCRDAILALIRKGDQP